MNSDASIFLVRRTATIVCGLIALRLICAAVTPLAFDEAYYWTWSRHLAAGYYDHPPMVAWIIRAGTIIAGDTELGVRIVSVLLGLPMSYATYHAVAILFADRRIGADAAILLNCTLMVAVGTAIITPDAPLMVASSFVLLSLAKVIETRAGAWWLAVGLAVGVALLSKYTALFFGPAILIWLVVSPNQRRWLASPWPYLGGLVAFAVFAPVIWWNADHGWVSFIKQFGRARIDEFTIGYVAELVPAQFGLATPPVFILGAMGLYLLAVRKCGTVAACHLVSATVWVMTLYFAWHSLHARVEANWFSPVYPAFAAAAAVAAGYNGWSPQTQRFVARCRRWALPTGIVLLVLLTVQVNTGWLTAGLRDGSVRAVGIGWRELATKIEAVRASAGATCVLGPNYPTTSWLAFYLPRGTCVVAVYDRIRWPSEPGGEVLQGKVLSVGAASRDSAFAGHPGYLGQVATFDRRRGHLTIESFRLDLIDARKGDVLDRSPAPELR